MIPPPFTISPFDFHIRHILSLISLCLLFLEYAGTCRFEFTHIWSRPLSVSKVLFLVSRYYEIMGKAAHYCLIHLILGRSPYGISPQRCAIWYTFMFSESVLMVLILDIVLFLRVYALYKKNLWLFLLLIPISSPFVFGAYTTWGLWVRRQELFDGTCSAFAHDPTLGLAVGVSFITSHLLIWILCYIKRNVGYGHVPVVKLVVCEGTWIFIILFVIVAALMPTSIAVKTTNPFVTFVCPTTLVSILNCRIIQNMYSLGVNETARSNTCDDQDFQLTTFTHTQFGPEE